MIRDKMVARKGKEIKQIFKRAMKAGHRTICVSSITENIYLTENEVKSLVSSVQEWKKVKTCKYWPHIKNKDWWHISVSMD